MKKSIKKVNFKRKASDDYHFDLVELSDILALRPKDHNQFEHHKISFYAIFIITQGSGTHSINYRDYSYQKGTIFTLRKNNIHRFYESEAQGKFLVFTEDFVIRFADKTETLKLFQLFNELLGAPKLQLDNTDFTEISGLLGQIQKEYWQVKDNHSIEIIRNLIQVIIHRLYRIKAKGDKNFGNNRYQLQFIALQELIENNYNTSKKVSFYAQKMAVTPRTLNNITQSVVGKSTKALIAEIVILQIKRLLVNSQLTFTEIAYQTGFEDPTNFFKFFRKHTGFSPKQFKEHCQ